MPVRTSAEESSAMAPDENWRPTMAASSRTARSSCSSRSSRALSRAWIVGGIVSVERSAAMIHPSS